LGVEAGQGEPLVVDDVGVGRGAAEAPHVAEVLGELEADAAAGGEAAFGRAPVEALVDREAVGRRHLAVEELGGDQLDLGAGTGQRRREGAVVGRGESGWVD